ncbi:MAG TPA: hypothetical protein VK308_00310 [Pyrinomonadaceae bacterium]|nr:hypothetical protein [Pyrinomonadaceae bacterium]
MKKAKFNRGWHTIVIHRAVMFLAVLAVASGGFLFLESALNPVKASNPKDGSIGNTTGSSVTWIGDAPGGVSSDESTCQNIPANMPPYSPGLNCDTFTLTINGTATDFAGKRVRVRFSWASVSQDYDMVIRKESSGTINGPDAADPIVATSGNGTTNFEEATFSPADSGTGVYYVRAIYFAAVGPADQYNGSATVFEIPTTLPGGSCALPSYDNYQPPVGMPRRDNAGEPSVGVNWNTGNILAMARLTPYRASFTDSTSPASPTTGVSWFSRSILGNVTGFDPILFTDPITGRTIGGELIVAMGTTQAVASDDDLNTVTNQFATGGPVQGFDHQTIGGGPPKAGVPVQPLGSYPHMVYYASQQIAYATMATSLDGGLTYEPAIPMYTAAQCSGLHGHVKVAPDGTVYLPNKNCGGKAAVIVSEDNGQTFSVRPIPSSSVGHDDPSIGIGAGGRVYVGYTGADNQPHAVVSDDKGLTWRDDFNLGFGIRALGGVRSSVFPSVVAGDNNRAAVFFLATTSPSQFDPTGTDGGPATGPDPNTTDNFVGTWYPYIATTCDGGESWSVVRADNDPLRPGMKNPVQQGVICKNGTTCPGGPPDTRNLLDFNDVTVDSKGRVIAVYADGCITDGCVTLNDHSVAKEGNDGKATLTIIRQRGGMRLFSAFDAGGPAAPSLSPPAFAEQTLNGEVSLKWATPDDGGSPLTAYRIYRGVSGGIEQMVREVQPDVHTFRDRLKKRGNANYYYRVTAVNAYGESPRNIKTFVQNGE